MVDPSGDAPLLTHEEVRAELKALTELGGLPLRDEVFDALLELTQLDVVPTAIAQVLKSLCTKAKAKTPLTPASVSR